MACLQRVHSADQVPGRRTSAPQTNDDNLTRSGAGALTDRELRNSSALISTTELLIIIFIFRSRMLEINNSEH